MLMSKNVNNDVSKDSPIQRIVSMSPRVCSAKERVQHATFLSHGRKPEVNILQVKKNSLKIWESPMSWPAKYLLPVSVRGETRDRMI